jgi:DNA-binding transcriptional LysR family regulator
MDLRQLRYFAAVARTGHLTRAAETLGMQQPPLTQQIRRLEAEAGLALFERHPKGMRLTEAGCALLADAERLLADFDALRLRLHERSAGERGTLALAFTSSAAAHAFIPRALREMRQHHPGVELRIDEDHAAAVTDAVAAARLHAGLIRAPVARPDGLQFETLLREPLMFALPADHALAARPAHVPVPLRALQGEPLILVRRPGAPGLYASLLELCARAGVQPRIVAEVERMMTNLNLVAAGAGLSVVPASMCGHHAGAVAYRPLPPSVRLDAPLTLVTRSADPSPLTHVFAERLRALARRWPD